MLESVVVREWMTSPVITVSPDTLISKAHLDMKEKGVRRLIVVADDRPVGVVTLSDVREAKPSDATGLSIWELNYMWAQLTVEKIMTRNPITVHPEALIIDAAELMLKNKVSGLPVVDDQNELVGILTESDVFRMLINSRSKADADTNG